MKINQLTIPTTFSFKNGYYEMMNKFLHETKIVDSMENHFMSFDERVTVLMSTLIETIERYVSTYTIKLKF